MRASARGSSMASAISCSRRCAISSAAMSRGAGHLEPSVTDTQPAPATTLVIFGASGDLTRRLLIPSLCNMRRAGLLGDGFKVIGVAGSPMDDEAFRHSLADMGAAAADWQWLAPRL